MEIKWQAWLYNVVSCRVLIVKKYCGIIPVKSKTAPKDRSRPTSFNKASLEIRKKKIGIEYWKLSLVHRITIKTNKIGHNTPHNKAVKPTNFVRHALCETQTSRRHRKSYRFPASRLAQNWRLTAVLYGLRKLEMKNEIVWPSAIRKSRKWENAHLRRPPKSGPDSSFRSIVWPSANGGLDERKRNARLEWYPKVGSDSNLRSIVRPSAVGRSKEDKHQCGGFRPSVRTGSVCQNRPSAWRIE